MSNDNSGIKIGISHGDINGIGYEVIIKTLMDPRIVDNYIPIVFGSPKVAAYHRKALNITNFSFNSIKEIEEATPKRAHIINCLDDEVRVELGKATQLAGESAVIPLSIAADHLAENKIDVLVTAPINKHTSQSDQFPYPGHTEFLKSRFDVDEVLMIMVSENMKIGVVTGHIPLSEVSSSITKELIMSKLRIMDNSLKVDFGIRKPKIAVLSINPHAGDEGLLGKEEQDVVIPALEIAAKEEILAFGPYPSDGFFGAGSFTKFDGVLAMYHDQGLIPFKALAFDSGVNYTAGLPVIRTSPNHGTAYDLAGKGEASEHSFRNAMYLACDIFKNRKVHAEITSNPLKPYKVDTRSGTEDLPSDVEQGND
jgi:4-hydroxythreonine-4-phosphate dehydrogenase